MAVCRPSHCAILKGNLDGLKLLIEYNANIWIKNKNGDYPIHETVSSLTTKNEQIYELLKFIFYLHPNKINIPNTEHKTALHLAASLGDIETCRLLIECGARVNSILKTSSVSFHFHIIYIQKAFLFRLLN